MPTTADWKPDSTFQALVFGKFKSGKTAGAGTFPRPNFIDFDSGIATVASNWWKEKFGDRVVQYEQFVEKKRTPRGVVMEPNAFDDACKYFDECMKAEGKWNGQRVSTDMFDTWIVDSGTTLVEAASNKAKWLLGGRIPGSKSDTQKNAETHGLVVLKQQDYGAERSMTEQFIRMVKNSGKNVVILCHEKEQYSKDGDAVEAIIPLFTGQSAERIPLMFDEVYRLRAVKDGPNMRRLLQTQPTGVVQVGSRLGLPNDTEWSWEAIQTALGRGLSAPKEK